jgi:hypothetical protein
MRISDIVHQSALFSLSSVSANCSTPQASKANTKLLVAAMAFDTLKRLGHRLGRRRHPHDSAIQTPSTSSDALEASKDAAVADAAATDAAATQITGTNAAGASTTTEAMPVEDSIAADVASTTTGAIKTVQTDQTPGAVDALDTADTSNLTSELATTDTPVAADPASTPATAPALSSHEHIWEQAYEQLREQHETMVEDYEKILSQILDGSDKNIINRNDRDARRKQMVELVDRGLAKIAPETNVKNKIGQGLNVVLALKEIISTGIQATPQAALPWAGVCVALQVLVNPIEATEKNQKGIEYVVGRMNWYSKLSNKIFSQDTSSSSRDLEAQIVDLYKQLLLYQIKSVCSYYSHRAFVFVKDLVNHYDWDGDLANIKQAESVFGEDSKIYHSQEILSLVKELVRYQATKLDEQDNQLIRAISRVNPLNVKMAIEDAKGGLFRDSFVWILRNEHFCKWRNHDEDRLLWIRGDPGKGKTMLISGIIDELQKTTSLVSFFFCQANDPNTNSAVAVLRGLIYQLVQRHPPLIAHVKARHAPGGDQIFEQWFSLSGMLTDILRYPGLPSMYLAIDALDECEHDRPKLLALIIESLSWSSRVKWIVSSRNWPQIVQVLGPANSTGRLAVNLEINAETVSEAVNAYINYKTSKLPLLQEDVELRLQIRDQVRKGANGTFLWVALAFKELEDLGDATIADGQEILDLLENMPSGLEELYARMLGQIERLPYKDPGYCWTILQVMVLAYRPINLAELSILTGFPEGLRRRLTTLKTLVEKCGSFLTVKGDIVNFIHQSAKDFVVNDPRAVERVLPLPFGLQDGHRAVYIRSVTAMEATLKRNMYDLSSPGLRGSEVQIPDQDPLVTVRYSCLHWIDHVCEAYCEPGSFDKYAHDFEENGVISTFLKKYTLYWFEALGLMQRMSDCISDIKKFRDFLAVWSCMFSAGFGTRVHSLLPA